MNKVPHWLFAVSNSMLFVVSVILFLTSMSLRSTIKERDENKAAYEKCASTACKKCAEPEALSEPEALYTATMKKEYVFPMASAEDSYIAIHNPPFSKEDIKKQLEVVCVGGFQYWFGFQGVSAIMAPRFGVLIKGQDPVPLACYEDGRTVGHE